MAAQIHPKPLTRKPVLLSKVEGSQDVVNMAVIVPKEDGVISVSEDRTVRVWMKRDSGQFWPSIYHAMPASCSCMCFNPETRRLTVGLDNGTISEFVLAEDYNKMNPGKTYLAHQARVSMVLFVLEMEWLLSTGQDKLFTWHCSESGQRLGSYRTAACASCLQFDVETRHAFVGDHSGQVTILKLEQDNCSLITTFKGHAAGVTALCWDPVQRLLFSGSSDHSIIIWDIGGRKGTALELQGHKHQSGWTVTPARNVTNLFSGTSSKCGITKRLVSDSIIAGNVGRPSVGSAALRDRLFHSWGSSLRCGSVTAAMRLSQMNNVPLRQLSTRASTISSMYTMMQLEYGC
ncbi:hypothetical protein GDO86_004549 [Hymenochirus boettgeri]|uniref:WD repeat and FYVE domain containing 2 n=1 Tax=Hymenochirus boettgeri TaxID=247094 RepID=A0A8T2K892_9PIPI|nr:hypothetical protein GDO86_004549 [Hymenochirus boettgeri]